MTCVPLQKRLREYMCTTDEVLTESGEEIQLKNSGNLYKPTYQRTRIKHSCRRLNRYIPLYLTCNCWPSFWSDHANLNSSNQWPGCTSPLWAVHVVKGWFRRMLIRGPWLERTNQIRATRLLKQYLNAHTFWFQICSSLVQKRYLE